MITTTLRLDWLNGTISFFKKHFLVVFTLGFIAGLGRVIQLRGFGPVSPSMHLVLEVIIETARAALFLYILGSASFKMGLHRFAGLFRRGAKRAELIKLASQNLKHRWKSLLLNFVVYLLLAWVINVLIDKLAYETCFYLTMKDRGILSPNSSEWTIILFFKNLTVIPLTFIFNTLLLFYATDKLKLARNQIIN